MSEETPQGVTVKDLLDAGLHFGHQTRRWNPKMKKYIFGKRNGIHIIDLNKSLAKLEEAVRFVSQTVADGKNVLFVGTKKQAQEITRDIATGCGQHFVTHRWLGGMLTNMTTIHGSIKRMREIEAMEKDGTMAAMHKQEASKLRREFEKLSRNLCGVANMTRLPGAMFVVDINREAIAVAEANTLGIPVVAIVDTNCDPDPIRYVIPGNDDAMRGIKLIACTIRDAIAKSAAEYGAKAAAEAALRKEQSAAAPAGEGQGSEGRPSRERRSPSKPRTPRGAPRRTGTATPKVAASEAAPAEAPAAATPEA
jgi:small subunit ribosomal protein S2